MWPFDISAGDRLCASDMLLNLKDALIDGDVRGPCRVQGLVLLRFFAERYSKNGVFDKLLFE